MRAAVLAVLVLATSAVAVPTLAQQVDPVFATCAACHSLVKGKNGIGPSLAGVVGAKKAAVAGYTYSAGLKAKGGTWTAAELDTYLTDPAAFAPGTKMIVHVRDPAKRAAVIALLKKAS